MCTEHTIEYNMLICIYLCCVVRTVVCVVYVSCLRMPMPGDTLAGWTTGAHSSYFILFFYAFFFDAFFVRKRLKSHCTLFHESSIKIVAYDTMLIPDTYLVPVFISFSALKWYLFLICSVRPLAPFHTYTHSQTSYSSDNGNATEDFVCARCAAFLSKMHSVFGGEETLDKRIPMVQRRPIILIVSMQRSSSYSLRALALQYVHCTNQMRRTRPATTATINTYFTRASAVRTAYSVHKAITKNEKKKK